MSLIAWFHELPDEKLGLIAGGKGASLCRMYQNGFPVPEGFMVRAKNPQIIFDEIDKILPTLE